MSDEYTSENLVVYRGTEFIRKRPGMYLGSTGPDGLVFLVMETVRFALGRFADRNTGRLDITFSGTDTVCIQDHAAPLTLTTLPPTVKSLSLSESIIPILASLTWHLNIDVHADGVQWRQSFARGERLGDRIRVGPTTHTGNTFTFRPDPEMFTETTSVPVEPIRRRLHELAAQHPGLRFILNGEEIHHPDGLAALFTSVTDGRWRLFALPHPESIETQDGRASLMLGWVNGDSESIHALANGCPTWGGERLRGFRRALADRFRPLMPGLPVGEVVRNGLGAVMAFEVTNIEYAGATKERVKSREAYRLLHVLTRQALDTLLCDSATGEWIARHLIERHGQDE